MPAFGSQVRLGQGDVQTKGSMLEGTQEDLYSTDTWQNMTKLDTVKNLASRAGLFFLFLTCLFIPFSTSLMGAAAIATTACWLLSGQPLTLPRLIRNNGPVFWAMILFLLLVIGLSYSPAPLPESLAVLKKYRELFYFVVTVSLVMNHPQAAQRAEDGFVAGCVLLLLVSYAMFLGLIPTHKFGYSIVYHITHSFFMAVLAFWCLQRAFNRVPHLVRIFWLLLFIAATVNLFYIAPGRTGMLVYIALLLLTLIQRLPWQYSIPAGLLTAALIAVAFYSSSNFSTRVMEALDEIQNYQAESSRTSLGMRFDWWQNSLQLISEKPLFGHGTGSFSKAQAALIEGTKTKATDNPHNEYLLLGVQSGLLGTGLFVAFLLSLIVRSISLLPPQRFLLQGVVVAMAAGCLMNSFLLDSHPGHFFAVLAGLLSIPPATATRLRM